MSNPYDKFLNRKLADKWPPAANEANAMRNLLHGTIDSHQAAREFTEKINASTTIESTKGNLWGIWPLILELAAQFPEHHHKLVSLMNAICQLPDLIIRDEIAVQWSELPRLSEVLSETVFNWSGTSIEGAQFGPQVNLIAFIAKLTSQGIPAMDFIRNSEMDMWHAFEKSPNQINLITGASARSLDLHVPIAAQWILHAGVMIYKYQESMNLPARDGLWTGRPGFSIKRWNFWKMRAEWIADLPKGLVRLETKSVARDVVKKMEQIEEEAYM